MKRFNLGIAVITCALFISTSSCNSVDKKAALIPVDAAFVVHLNTGSLSSKLSWDEVKKSSWFMDISKDEKDSLTRKILEDPANSGMDTKEGFFVFAEKGTDGVGYLAFTGNILDAGKFEAFNKSVKEAGEVNNKDGIKTILFGDKAAVNWNDNKFLYLVQNNFKPSFTMDSGRRVYQEPVKADFHNIALRLFNYKKDSLLISNVRFSDLLKDEGDVHFWSNAESMSTMDNPQLGFLSLLKLDVYFKETVSAATLSFDKGKISVHAKTYSNKEMQELFKKYSGEPINANLIQRIPSDNVVGLIAANFKPEGLKAFLKLGGLDGIVNQFLGEYQLTLDEIVAATKGDLLIAVSDVGMKRKMVSLGKGMDSLPITSPSANIIFAMPVTNKAPFEKLMAITQQLSAEGKLPPDVSFKLNNELFVAGSQASSVDEFLKGGKRDFPFLSKISGHPFALYIDLNRIFNSFGTDTASELKKASTDMWKDVVVTGGEFKDEAIQQNVEVNLVDQNTNSLQQLNTYFDKLAATKKKPL